MSFNGFPFLRQPERVTRPERRALRDAAARASERAKGSVACFAARRLLARYFGKAVASVGLSTRFARPDDPSPTLQGLATRYGEEFEAGSS